MDSSKMLLDNGKKIALPAYRQLTEHYEITNKQNNIVAP